MCLQNPKERLVLIDVQTQKGQRIIGEIKTTVPYSGARNDLGAQQKQALMTDFSKLNKATADYKYPDSTSPDRPRRDS